MARLPAIQNRSPRRWWSSADALRQDLRLAVRLLGKHWGFSTIAVIVIAFGTGANVAIFSVANALLYKPLPVDAPDRLVRVYGGRFSNVPYEVFREFRAGATRLTGLAAWQLVPVSVGAGRDASVVQGRVVSGNYFDVLGVRPVLGQLIQPRDERPSVSNPVAVLSADFWRRRFGEDPSVLGTLLIVNGEPFTVIGVAPHGFHGALTPFRADVWLPYLSPGSERSSVQLIGRLGADQTLGQAQAELLTLNDRLKRADPDGHAFETVSVYGASGVHPEMAGPLTAFATLLMTLVGLVLVIACFNLASLFLARSTARRTEIGVRRALGAGRLRIVRQLLTEGALISAIGTTAGFIVATWLTGLVSTVSLTAPIATTVAFDPTPDLGVLVFGVILAILSVLIFGLAPALQATRAELLSALRPESTSDRRLARLRGLLITGQLAVSVMLLATTALLLQSWRNAVATDVGFDPVGVTAAQVDLTLRGYTESNGRTFYDELLTRLNAALALEAATLVEIVPLTLSNRTVGLIPAERADPAEGQFGDYRVYMTAVSRGYFETMHIPLLAGRDFIRSDGPTAPPVVIVNQTLAERFWPGGRAVGQQLRSLIDDSARPVEVVGVVADSKYVTVGEPSRSFAYYPLTQAYAPRVTVLARSQGDDLDLGPVVRETVARVDPLLPITSVNRLAALTSTSLLPITVTGVLAGGFGVLTLVLACLGVYGVLSYIVRQRAREIGIRMALGARAASVAQLVVRQSARWIVVGLALGLVGSLAVTRLASGLLHEVSATDPLALAVTAAAMLLVGGVASLVPALQASRTDPMSVLRAD